MATDPVRIEIRGLATERDAAQRDLRETLGALEEKLLPQRAARRLVRQHEPALVVAGVVAIGVAIGLTRDPSRTARLVGLGAAGIAGAIINQLAR